MERYHLGFLCHNKILPKVPNVSCSFASSFFQIVLPTVPTPGPIPPHLLSSFQMPPRTLTSPRSTSFLYQAIAVTTVLLASSQTDAFQISSLVNAANRRPTPSSALGMATWSNGQAIREYQGTRACSTICI